MNRPSQRRQRPFLGPVHWLLGPDLIFALKGIATNFFLGEEVDPKDWMKAQPVDYSTDHNQESEFWFDYIADTGDSEGAMYSLAWLLADDLWCTPKNVSTKQSPEATKLQRGRFLFLGGDTAYHVADYPTLAERFHQPIQDAFDARFPDPAKAPSRDLLGIPGNHDYYDNLIGFNKQVAAPISNNEVTFLGKDYEPLLRLVGVTRPQQASYVAAKLPWNWSLLGIDAQNGFIDFRQYEFFNRYLTENGRKRLIVCTPEPTTCFGKYEDPGSLRITLFESLGLKCAFLKGETLPADETRLDLSGNYHHYARYWGNGAKGQYASVVSGGGGAFLHPSDTNVHEVEPVERYPAPLQSRKAVLQRLLKPERIWIGGRISLLGALVWMTVYHGNIDLFSELHTSLKQHSRSLEVFTLSIACIIIVFATSLARYRKKPEKREDTAEKKDARGREDAHHHWLSWPILALSVCWPARAFVAERLCAQGDLLISAAGMLITLGVLGTIVYWKAEYAAFIVRNAHKTDITRYHRWFQRLLSVLFVVLGTTAMSRFGAFPARTMLFYVAYILFTAGLIILLPVLAYRVGGGLYRSRKLLRAGFVPLGLLHAGIQLGMAFACKEYWSPLGGALLVVGTFSWSRMGVLVMPRISKDWPLRFMLPIGWLAFAATMVVALRYVAHRSFTMPVPWLWIGMVGSIVACANFGWYLATALVWNGHNNEAGGAARLDKYKQFIRFRLNKDCLTAFVIGVDDPPDTRKPTSVARLIDTFELRAPDAK